MAASLAIIGTIVNLQREEIDGREFVLATVLDDTGDRAYIAMPAADWPEEVGRDSFVTATGDAQAGLSKDGTAACLLCWASQVAPYAEHVARSVTCSAEPISSGPPVTRH